ncbi:MAG: FAD-dependent oxidoreductase [Pseudomonadota bacterium]|nr:FAD-dependent oxidoreductase [Pseudomonadota bacterium]
MENFAFELGADGIAVVTWDMPGRSMNLIDRPALAELEQIVQRLAADQAVKGAVITSAKAAFSGGADLAMLDGLAAAFAATRSNEGDVPATAELMAEGSRLSRIVRALETCGKPIVAAINGTCLGGAFELVLACHHRIAADDPGLKLGLPEAKVGLLPGGGGTQRLPRLVGADEALKLMLKGRHIDAAYALKIGAIDAIAPRDGLVDRARQWIATAGKAIQPWDDEGFKQPGGAPYSAQGLALWPAANALYRRETYDNYDAQRAIMSCVYEGLSVKSIDAGLRIEARYFTGLLLGRQSRNMIRSLFTSPQALTKGARRPPVGATGSFDKIGIVGAGFMGAGIAFVAARAGIDVVLIDRDRDAAEQGKRHSAALMDRAIASGRATDSDKSRLLEHISPSAAFADLVGSDLVIEAVFEERAVKADVLTRIEAEIAPGALLASNTSTLPVTSLAESLARPVKFLGLHFFSPVDRMDLVEIIRGGRTSDEAVAQAFDFVRRLGKTPIIVNDSRGFFTSRVVMTYMNEGMHMLEEGVPAALIENAGRAAGMPVGPLALADEVALDLSWKILQATRADLGPAYRPGPVDRLLEEMVARRGRHGRKNGKGFYDYPAGRKKSLWPGIADLCPAKDASTFSYDQLKERLLLVQALETARCFEEGVLTDVREADVGAILGFGFAPFTGGPLSYIDTVGARHILERCRMYVRQIGPRYAAPNCIISMARKGDGFYERFSPAPRRAA